ncbi:MAG TPA: winged helix-turn-helix domain-containing protein [Terriglobia bacterium]|nr:winged helix-turn-helix domain-containing protein [Terriglobia bacterium]
MSHKIKHLYEFGAYCLDATDRLLLLDGKVVPLTPKAVETLLLLVQNAGRLVSKDELIRAVWPDTFVEEGGLTRNISVLRKALGDSDNGLRFIDTIPKRGYRFVAEVKEQQAALGRQPGDAVPVPQQPELTSKPSAAAAGETPHVSPASLEGVSGISHDGAQPKGERTRVRVWMLLASGIALVLGAVALLRVLRPMPVPRVLRSVQITTFGRVGTGEPLVTADHIIYFEERRGGSWHPMQVSSEEGDPVPIPVPFQSATVLAVSPNASQLLVASFSGVEQERPFWLLPALGGPPWRLGELTGHDAIWFPGGNRIIYTHGNDFLVANADGSDPRKLLTAPGTPQWPRLSPDGKTLRFTMVGPAEELYSLWEASTDGSHLHPLLPGWRPPPTVWGEGECCGAWTPDGKYFLFRSARNGVHSLWSIREKNDLFHPANHEPMEVYATHEGLGNPVLSTDGKRLFVVNSRHSSELAQYDSPSHRFVPYLSGIPARWVDFSRDGRWVAYVDTIDGSLWRIATDGSQQLRLTSAPPVAVYPRWSPDGKRVLFHLVNSGVRRKLCVVSSEGGKIETLLPGSTEEEQADWFPDGNSVLFDRHTSSKGNEHVLRDICILDLTTRQVSVLPGSEGLKFSALGPGARYAAAVTEDARQLMLYDFRSRRWVKLAGGDGIFNARWTQDDKYVYYQDLYGGLDQPVSRVRVADRRVERVTSPKLDLPVDVTAFALIGLTPDGSPLVSLGRSNSDIYALDLDLP